MFTKTVNLFISQPMHGIDNDTILKQRSYLRELVELFINATPGLMCTFKVELIDQFNLPEHVSDAVSHMNETQRRLYLLGRSIQRMREADIVLFYGDWNHAKGCKVEYEVCEQYGITYLYYSKLMIFIREEHPEYLDKFGWLFPYPNPAISTVESDDDDDNQYEGDLSVYADSLTEEEPICEWRHHYGDMEKLLAKYIMKPDDNYVHTDISYVCSRISIINNILDYKGFKCTNIATIDDITSTDSPLLTYTRPLDKIHSLSVEIVVFSWEQKGCFKTSLQLDFYECDEDEAHTVFTERCDITQGALIDVSFTRSKTHQTKFQDHLIPFDTIFTETIKPIVDEIEEYLSK